MISSRSASGGVAPTNAGAGLMSSPSSPPSVTMAVPGSESTSPLGGDSQVPEVISPPDASSTAAKKRRSSTTTRTPVAPTRASTKHEVVLAHVLTGLHESDDDELDVEDRNDAGAKTKKKKRRHSGVLHCLTLLLRRLVSTVRSTTTPASPRNVNSRPAVLRNRKGAAGRRGWWWGRALMTSNGSLVLLFSMALVFAIGMTTLPTDSSGWRFRLLTRIRGDRGAESLRAGGAGKLIFPSDMVLHSLLGRSAGRLPPRRPSTVSAPMGRKGDDEEGTRREPDYGGLDIRFLEEQGEARRIYKDWSLWEGKYDRPRPTDDTNDYYYSLDDDNMRNTYRGWRDATLYKTKRCRRTNWHRNVPVNCNGFHELDVRSVAHHGGFRLVGAGSYKHVYVLNTTFTSGAPDLVVFKNFGVAAKFDTKNYERMRKDVLVAERVGPHPLIVDVYGYCGLAQLDEAMPDGGLENVALPSHGQYGITLHDKDHLDPRNSLLPSEKLALALDMFEAIALLHNYAGGVIVHDDIQLLQFLLTPDRKHVKLNDFNRMEVMLWDENDQAYCRYRNGPGQGDWRSPEEFQDLPLDEKIDIFSLGNNLISVLTGVVPFYSAKGFKEVQRRVIQGVKPNIDPRWKERSYAERKIVELIERCQAYDPNDRIDAGAAVTFLRDAIRTNALHHLHEDKHVRPPVLVQ